MKILIIERSFSTPPPDGKHVFKSDDMTRIQDLPQVTLVADSANVRHGTPLFVTDFAAHQGWVAELVPALIIDRLGKWVEPEMAHRYFSAIAPALRLRPAQGAAPTSALLTGFDGAFHMGTPISADAIDAPITLSLEGCGSITITPEQLAAQNAVTMVSRFMTIKTGDIIVPTTTDLCSPLLIGSRIEAAINGINSINLKIK